MKPGGIARQRKPKNAADGAFFHVKALARALHAFPRFIGGAVVFLASDAARFVHDAVLPVDGGGLAR